MGQYTSYYLYQKYEKRGDGEWLPVNPNVYSVDGDGTMPVSAKTDDDPSCGYVPPIEPQYRWVDLDPDTDYYCISCSNDGYKLSGTYGESGETFSINCSPNVSPNRITTADTSPYSAMTYAKIGDCASIIDPAAFSLLPGLTGVSIPNSIWYISQDAFRGSNALVDCMLPESVTSIGDYAFNGCTSLSNIVLWDNTITGIPAYCFADCDNMLNINIPKGVTSIGTGAFQGCGGLSEIIMPDSVKSIGGSAFSGCTGLLNINIPSGVTNIYAYAFYNCTSLQSVYCLATTPPTLGSYVFDGTNNCPIYVPAASVETYKTSSGWSSYASRIQPITA